MPDLHNPLPSLVADIGGTNTRIALADGVALRQGSIRRFANADHQGFGDVAAQYLAAIGAPPIGGVSVAVAGPVQDGRAQMTNLDWELTLPALAALSVSGRAVLLNDLQAQGHALPHLAPQALRPLLAGRAQQGAARLVVGLGTGFNAAPVHDLGGGRVLVPASEAGHIHLPRHGPQEEALAQHLATRHGIASVEEVLSGRGLVALHQWLSGRRMTAAELIALLDARDPDAQATGQVFTTLLARTLATLALAHLPRAGIYLIGGVARAMAPHMPRFGLEAGFTQMGRFSAFMEGFPLWLVEDDYAALIGCAACLDGAQG